MSDAAPTAMEVTGQLRTLARATGPSLRYRVWPVDDARATVVFFNGIMSHAGWFSPLAPGFAHARWHMVGADRRGSGPNDEARGDAPSAQALIDDAVAIIDAEHDGVRPLVVVGWCWGSVLAVHVALALGARVDRLVLVTPGLFPSAEVRERAAAAAAAAAGHADDEPCVPTPIREALFTDGPALEGFILRDPWRLRAITPRFGALSGKLTQLAALRLPKLSPPLLLVLAGHDGATDNAATTAAFAKLPPGRCTRVTLPTHHGVGFEAPEALVGAIVDFAGPPPQDP